MRNPLEVRDYLEQTFQREDPILDQVKQDCDAQGLPDIHISFQAGQLLTFLAGAFRAQNILEIGTLGGFSTIHLARSLQEKGRIVTLERNPRHAEIAKKNIQRAGFSNQVQILVGHAIELLDQMIMSQRDPFDFIFIDADKKNTPKYLEKVMQLVKKGSIIVFDNLIAKRGKLSNPDPQDRTAIGQHECNRLLAANKRLNTFALPVTIKSDGFIDAMSFSIVTED